MVILDVVRAVGPLPDGAVVELVVADRGDLDLARRWAGRTGNTVVKTVFEDEGPGTIVVRRGRPPDPALTLGADRMPGARLRLYNCFHCNLACDY